ncbi:hypothetical protein U1Q18_012559 [Sarracenia purpurea var. burkii]
MPRAKRVREEHENNGEERALETRDARVRRVVKIAAMDRSLERESHHPCPMSSAVQPRPFGTQHLECSSVLTQGLQLFSYAPSGLGMSTAQPSLPKVFSCLATPLRSLALSIGKPNSNCWPSCEA